MKKKKEKKEHGKNVVIISLCCTIIVMALGFIVLSIKVDHVKAEEKIFDVAFIGVKQIASIKGGLFDPSGELKIDTEGKILHMDFTLYQEHDEIDYEITIENKGNVDASIVKLLMSPDFEEKSVAKDISPVSISLSDISGKILEPGEETTVKLTVLYNSSNPNEEVNPDINVETNEKKVSGKVGLIAESYQAD